ncbi:MAG TPA: hypothetical protein VMR41_04435 [Patescibacteria group bacterium]|nr:hypothetical protein [Patescibacteria group bacterium]
MAKRSTGVGNKKSNHPHKTKARLERKRIMLSLKTAKHHRK